MKESKFIESQIEDIKQSECKYLLFGQQRHQSANYKVPRLVGCQNNAMGRKKVAIYARVSTRDQDPEMQLLDLRRYANERGFEIYHEFADVGISGTKDSRPALDELIQDARKRKFDVVLVWRFDRFARSTKHLVDARYEFRNLGIDFISYQEAIDTSSPMGEAMFTIISAMAKLERDIISERVKGGLRKARENGKMLGRPRAEVEPEEVRRLRDEGLSFSEIAARIYYTDRSGRKRKISKTQVSRILNGG